VIGAVAAVGLAAQVSEKAAQVMEREANRPPEVEGRREPNSAAVGLSALSAGLGIGRQMNGSIFAYDKVVRQLPSESNGSPKAIYHLGDQFALV
jgi:hypothetical protein